MFIGTAHDLLPIEDLVLLLTRQIHDLTAKVMHKEEILSELSKHASNVLSDFELNTVQMLETLHTTRDRQVAKLCCVTRCKQVTIKEEIFSLSLPYNE